jgi:mono/diheme cytochrome c family protein
MRSRPAAFHSTIALTTALLVVACATTRSLQTAPPFATAEEQFKYGSIGIEATEGLPYWIWQVLPRVFADKLPSPGGYTAFGFIWESGRELPVGLSKADAFGGPRVAINCAFCHTSTYRVQPLAPRRLVPAGPGHQVNPQAYVRFLHAVSEDPRFNADDILTAIAGLTRLSWMQRMQYRFLLIPATRKGLQRQRQQYAWMDRNPDWGPGRIDPFNPVKFGILRQPVDETIGNADMIPIWNMRMRQGMSLHWDGLTSSLHESVISSAIGDGASRKSVALDNLQRIEQWLIDLPPAPYPFAHDAARAEDGRGLYQKHCAQCHAPGGARTGSVIPVDEIGTDRHRLDMWTPAAASAYNAFADDYPWDFTAFRKTNGYVAQPLDGVWLRAPYLHNGSVPTLEELLDDPARRRVTFYRGYDVYDSTRVGFVSDGDAARRRGVLYDTRRPGNGNGGHLYGSELTAAEKQALVEYLKTL